MGKAKSVNVDGIKTSYFEGGSGEAMVLFHGRAGFSTPGLRLLKQTLFLPVSKLFP